MTKHLGINHQKCSIDELMESYDQGCLWQHLLFRVYAHSRDPLTGRIESFLPFLACGDSFENYIQVQNQLNQKSTDVSDILGVYSHTRICTEEDEKLLTRQIISQAAVICFNPNRKGRGAFINRKLIKQKLPKNMHHLVTKARKLPQYRFIREYSQEVFKISLTKDEDTIIDFWRLCNTKDPDIDAINNFFESNSLEEAFG